MLKVLKSLKSRLKRTLHRGINVRTRYLLRVTMQRSYGNTVVQEFKVRDCWIELSVRV